MSRDELYGVWLELQDLEWNESCVSEVQKRFEKATIALYKKITGKNTKSFTKAHSYLKENHAIDLGDMRKPFEEEVSLSYQTHKNRKELLEKTLVDGSKDFVVQSTKKLNRIAISYSSNYTSQPSHNKYARVNLQADKTLLEILGYKVEVRVVNQHVSEGSYSRYWEDYELWANLSEFDFYMLRKSHFISVLNWAVLCWKNGTNPKVYFQFLSDEDYNKSQALAYECNYEITKENMELELSWEEIEKLKR
jgi:hypothetical protein